MTSSKTGPALAIAVLLSTLVIACGGDDSQRGDAATSLPISTVAAPVEPTASAPSDPMPSLGPADTATPDATPSLAPTATPTAKSTASPTPTITPNPTPAQTAESTQAAEPAVALEATPLPPLSDATEIEGRWEGIKFVFGQVELPLTVTFTMSGSGMQGKMDIPIQNAFGLELTNVTVHSSRLYFEHESPIGLAVWQGELRDDSIEGEFNQAGLVGTFQLHRVENSAAAPSEDEDVIYIREEVEFLNGDITLAGDLTFPDAAGPHPAVVLISGSGGQDRDSNFYGFKVFAELTDHIVGQGIAVLRFDDRGIGGSTGDWLQATLEDRASDVQAAVALLLAREDIDSERIGLIGHSEGGLVALIAANQTNEISFVALLAAPAIPGVDVLREQLRILQRINGGSPEKIEGQKAHQELVLRAAISGDGWEDVEASIRARVLEDLDDWSPEMRESVTDQDLYAESMVAVELAWLRSPWFRSFVKYDPRPAIAALDVPVLAVFAKVDIQVPADINSAAFTDSIAESTAPSHTIETVQADHGFRDPLNALAAHYSQETPVFLPEFVEFLLDWLAERTASP